MKQESLFENHRLVTKENVSLEGRNGSVCIARVETEADPAQKQPGLGSIPFNCTANP